MNPNVIFDAESHRYWLEENGERREVPGVSRILEATGNHGSFKPAARYFEKGRRIHELCEMFDRDTRLTTDDLEEADLRLSTYVAAWLAFKRENGVRILGIEEVVFHRDLFYAGTLDRTIVMRGRDRPIVLDIKSGVAADWHPLQLAAYVLAHGQEKWTEYDGADIYLKPNGRYTWAPLHPGTLAWNIDRWRQIAQQYRDAP